MCRSTWPINCHPGPANKEGNLISRPRFSHMCISANFGAQSCILHICIVLIPKYCLRRFAKLPNVNSKNCSKDLGPPSYISKGMCLLDASLYFQNLPTTQSTCVESSVQSPQPQSINFVREYLCSVALRSHGEMFLIVLEITNAIHICWSALRFQRLNEILLGSIGA